MRRVLLGLGACALALTLSGTASAAGWHRVGCGPRRVVVVNPCRPCYTPAPVCVEPVAPPPCVVVEPVRCVPACRVITHYGHRCHR